MIKENHFRTNLEEIVLAVQSIMHGIKFTYDVMKGNLEYAGVMVNYYHGRRDQVCQDSNMINNWYKKAVYRNKIGDAHG